jgi:hypothetical protein
LEELLKGEDDEELRSRANRIMAEIRKQERTPSALAYWRSRVRALLAEGEVRRENFE